MTDMCTLMNIRDCADFLRMSPGALYQKIHRKEIPHYKRGGRVLFDRDEIEAWAKEVRVPTEAELQRTIK